MHLLTTIELVLAREIRSGDCQTILLFSEDAHCFHT